MEFALAATNDRVASLRLIIPLAFSLAFARGKRAARLRCKQSGKRMRLAAAKMRN
jgi:hypothetical protein